MTKNRMRGKRPIATLAASFLFSALIAACSSDTTEPVVAVEGSYVLSSISGAALPVNVTQTAEGQFFIDAGSLLLSTDGTFTLTETDRVVGDKATTTTVITSTGTYTASGSNITLHYTAPVRTVSGTAKTGVVTLTGGGLSFVYRK